MTATAARTFFMRKAWLPEHAAATGGSWASNVRLTVGEDGRWQSVQSNAPRPSSDDVIAIEAPVIPGLVNAHSHAFQRAIAGLTERSANGTADNFWSWREQMYRVALQITPEQLEAIATLLYAELLRGGYTHVCEFHYLHNDQDGRAYADAAELSLALVRAAQTVGIGMTLLPTLYMHSGFGATALRSEQRRFAGTPEQVIRLAERIAALSLPQVNAGIAIHSLRAVDQGALAELLRHAQDVSDRKWPLHIHIAEQQQEVDDCLRQHSQRPIEWLLNHFALSSRWNLVHATHGSPAELDALASTGAAIVICPSTEANLGDGVFDLAHWQLRGGRWSIGSDSHVTRSASEELRLLEYSQRLVRRQRNVAAAGNGKGNTADALLAGALAGGTHATALAVAGFKAGQRADFCVLDDQSSALLGISDDRQLDAWMFSSPGAPVRASYVAGRDRTPHPDQGREAFKAAMRALSRPI